MLVRLIPSSQLIVVLAFASCMSFCMSLPSLAQTGGDAREGLAYARENCAQCHRVERGTNGSEAMLAASFRQIANTPGMTAMALTVFFRTPHPTMPNLIIPPAQQQDVIAYIQSLRDKRK